MFERETRRALKNLIGFLKCNRSKKRGGGRDKWRVEFGFFFPLFNNLAYYATEGYPKMKFIIYFVKNQSVV